MVVSIRFLKKESWITFNSFCTNKIFSKMQISKNHGNVHNRYLSIFFFLTMLVLLGFAISFVYLGIYLGSSTANELRNGAKILRGSSIGESFTSISYDDLNFNGYYIDGYSKGGGICKHNPLVSVVTYVYCTPENERLATLINTCLTSIRRQNFHSYEHLIIDDGSTVDVASALKKLNDPHIRYIKQENHGISLSSTTFMIGAIRACGKYMMFLPSDDNQHQGSLFALSRILESRKDVVGALGDVRSEVRRGIFKKNTDLSLGKQLKLLSDIGSCTDHERLLSTVGNYMNGGALMFRRNCMDKFILPNALTSFAADYDLMVKIAHCGKIAFTPHIVLSYRMHADGNNRKKTRHDYGYRNFRVRYIRDAGMKLSASQKLYIGGPPPLLKILLVSHDRFSSSTLQNRLENAIMELCNQEDALKYSTCKITFEMWKSNDGQLHSEKNRHLQNIESYDILFIDGALEHAEFYSAHASPRQRLIILNHHIEGFLHQSEAYVGPGDSIRTLHSDLGNTWGKDRDAEVLLKGTISSSIRWGNVDGVVFSSEYMRAIFASLVGLWPTSNELQAPSLFCVDAPIQLSDIRSKITQEIFDIEYLYGFKNKPKRFVHVDVRKLIEELEISQMKDMYILFNNLAKIVLSHGSVILHEM